MASPAEIRDAYLAAHGRTVSALAGAGDLVTAELRSVALARFRSTGFPAAKDESWKYTSVAPIFQNSFGPDTVSSNEEIDRARIEAAVAEIGARDTSSILVVVNGRYSARYSRIVGLETAGSLRDILENPKEAGLSVHPLDTATHAGLGGFEALNAAFAADGAVIRIARGTRVEAPIHVLYFAVSGPEPTSMHPRSTVILEQDATATLVEHFVGDGAVPTLTNVVTNVYLESDAVLEHVKLQRESYDAFHVGRIDVHQARGSRYRSHSIAFGAQLSRTDISVELAGEHAECDLFGLYAIGGTRHADHQIVVDHAAASTTSREVYKGVLGDQARGVFTGKVLVRPDAQKIIAEQVNRNLLLGDGAVADSRPQLEIYADDVRCSHGATVGRLDEEALFYLRQRGLGKQEARRILTYAFASEIVDSISTEEVRALLGPQLHQRLDVEGETT